MNTITFVFSMGLGVALAQTNLPLPNDPIFSLEQTQVWKAIGAEEVMRTPIPLSALARIAVVYHDQSIACSHPDIAPNLDLSTSRNFVGGPVCDEYFHHGTAMAGLSAKCNNGTGICGVWDGPITFLSTFRRDPNEIPREKRFGDHVAAAYQYTLTLPQELVFLVDSTLMSEGMDGRMKEILQSIERKTILFSPAGNWPGVYGDGRGPDLSVWPRSKAETFGCYSSDAPNAICIGALDEFGNMLGLSMYGKYVQLGVLGQNVPTACPYSWCGVNSSTPEYWKVAGTSISDGLVHVATARAFAIFIGEHPETQLSPALVKQAVMEGACFEPKLVSADPRRFAYPARFCADGVLRWLRRYAQNKLEEAEPPAIQVAGTNFVGGWVEVYGSGFAEEAFEIPPFARIPYSMRPGHVRVWCNGEEALVGYASPTQVNVQLPAACGGEEPNAKKLALARSNRFGEIFPKNVVVVKVE